MEKESSLSVPHERPEEKATSVHITDELLSSYLEGDLAADEQTRVEAHLPTCSFCQGELAIFKKLLELISSLPKDTEETAPDFLERLHRRIEEFERNRPR